VRARHGHLWLALYSAARMKGGVAARIDRQGLGSTTIFRVEPDDVQFIQLFSSFSAAFFLSP
jgi:hypothetical protein